MILKLAGPSQWLSHMRAREKYFRWLKRDLHPWSLGCRCSAPTMQINFMCFRGRNAHTSANFQGRKYETIAEVIQQLWRSFSKILWRLFKGKWHHDYRKEKDLWIKSMWGHWVVVLLEKSAKLKLIRHTTGPQQRVEKTFLNSTTVQLHFQR